MSSGLIAAFLNAASTSAEITRQYAYKNWVTVKLGVFSVHSYKPFGGSEVPISVPTHFRRDNLVQPINIFMKTQGTVAFSMQISYGYYYEGSLSHKSNVISSGSVEHRCSFDYICPAADLTIGKIVKTRGDDGDKDGDSAYSVDLAQWNEDTGVPNGPRYIRINPSVRYFTRSELTPQTKDDEGIATFTIPIHVIEGSGIYEGRNRGGTITPI